MHKGRIEFYRNNIAISDFAHAEETETAIERLKGLLGQPPLTDELCLWIKPCNSIHMFFMKYPIDVIFLDVNDSICKLVHNIKPWQMSAKLGAHSVLEVAAGSIQRHGLTIGDVAKWKT